MPIVSPRLEQTKERRSVRKRVQAVLAIILGAVAASFLAYISGAVDGSGTMGSAASTQPALETAEARRLMRLLASVRDGSSGEGSLGTKGAEITPLPMGDQSMNLLTALGEKNLRCETALKQCKDDLEKGSTTTTTNGGGGAATPDASSSAKELQEMTQKTQMLQAEVDSLTAELEVLRKAAAVPQQRKSLLVKAEEDSKEPSLEADNLSLATEMSSSGATTTTAAVAAAQEPDAKPQVVSCGGIPGLSSDVEKEAKEAARKVLEECGAKQAPQQADAGSKNYACEATAEELQQYFAYTPRALCPDDWYFVQKLVYIKNCFCLPKRRCLAPAPFKYKEPSIPFPKSLFDPRVLRNENVRWTKQYWRSYDALNSRELGDCRDCFNLTLEATRWQVNYMGTIPIEQMLALKATGSIKIGLDAGGGTGSFAAKMAEHGVTIVTTAMNTETLGGDKEGGLPYMETIAQRGLIPLFVPHKVRQPFFDSTLDIVHNINSIKYFTIPEFEELLFEWDRILRPGGIMWFELFYAPVAEMPLYISVIEMFGYKKLYWNMTPKVDAAERNDVPHVYLNAVLEKPRRPDDTPPLKPVASS